MNESLKGIVFGAVGGAVGTYMMSYYWKAAEALHGHDPLALTREEPPHTMDDISVVGDQTEGEEGSTAAVGRLLHETVTGEEPSDEKKSTLSEGVHWSYGVAVSSLYGAIRRRRSMPDAAGGAVFGTALWALGDELMVPLLGLSKGPTAYPIEQHVHRWGAHIFYGIVAAATTQALFQAFAPAPTRRQVVINAVKGYATLKAAKSVARAATGAGRKLSRSVRPRKASAVQKAVRSTGQLARATTNGAPRAAVKNVVRSGQRVARTATQLFS